MRGIATYGVYVPYWRLDRKALAAALGAPSGSGTRSVASYDEDTTSLGVEAARAALRRAPRLAPEALYFATASPAYLDKTNATAIHAALDLAPSAPAFDMGGAVRSGAGALRAALDARDTALAVLSDIRTGLPGSADEREGRGGSPARSVRRRGVSSTTSPRSSVTPVRLTPACCWRACWTRLPPSSSSLSSRWPTAATSRCGGPPGRSPPGSQPRPRPTRSR